jgi:DNA-binding CsgD family transcriptional regulator
MAVPVEALVRELVVLALRTRDDDNDGNNAEVLLDLELDGVRCVLSRVVEAPPSVTLRGLTPREREVARMVASGYANKTIARILDISTWTVGTHLRRIFLKLGVSSRTAMVARLIEEQPSFCQGDRRAV